MRTAEEILDSYLDRPLFENGTSLCDEDILDCMRVYAKEICKDNDRRVYNKGVKDGYYKGFYDLEINDLMDKAP